MFNNCMQTSVEALIKGKFSSWNIINHIRLGVAQIMIVPNLAFPYLKNRL